MTEPAADDYPPQWRPKERREMDQQRQDRSEFELHVSALSNEEITRIRQEHS